jgi:hypothetical protein
LIVVRPSGDVSLTDDGVFTASAGNGSRSPRFTLSGASPNPARSLTRIGFSAPSAGTTVLAIHDVHGRRVRSLTLGAPESGTADVTWDLRDDAGQRVPVGVYFARLSGDGAPSRTKRIVVLQ